MAVTISLFFDRLRSAELLDSDEVETLWQKIPEDKRQLAAEKLVPKLIEAKKLTAYQAFALLKGNSDPLLLGDYVILERIGQGGMGQVYRAEHRRMKRMVALKVLPADAVRSTDAVKRFQREVQAAARLLHTNIVAAFDAGHSNDVHFLVMEYVQGEDLAVISKTRGMLPQEQVVDYVLQAARGLAYAHGKGVVHRDIKPANLLVDSDGVVKILDMGLARVDAGAAALRDQLTQSGQVMGTLDFMAPEQAYDTRTADARADIYSLGCTLYRLLTGETLYAGDSMVQVIMAHREQPVPSLRDKRPDLPAALDELFQSMVAKTPEERPANMNEVVSALEAIKAGVTGTSSVFSQDADPELSKFFSDVVKGSGVAKGSSVVKGSAVGKGSTKGKDSDAGKPSRPPPRSAGPVGPIVVDPVGSPQKAAGTTLNMGQNSGDTDRDATAAAAASGIGHPKKPASRLPAAPEADESGTNPVAVAQTKAKKQGSKLRALLIASGAAIGACLLAAGIFGVVMLALGDGKPKNRERDTTSNKTGNDTKLPKKQPETTPKTPAKTPGTTPKPSGGTLPPLPAGLPADKLFGLLADPPRIANLGRWQVDTVAPRRPVWVVAWANDNRRLAVAGEGGEVRIYDAATWKLQNVLLGHVGSVRALAWCPDGSRLVSCGVDKTVRLWRTDGVPGPIIPGFTRPNAAAWSPNGQWLAVGDSDSKSMKLQIFKADGVPGPAYFGHASGIWGISWNADNEQFVTSSEDKTLRVWNVRGGEGYQVFAHEAPLRDVSWNKDGRIATVDTAGTLYLHPPDGAAPRIFSKIGARAVAWNAGGTQLAVGTQTNVDIWNSDGQSTGQPQEAPGGAANLAFSPDGKQLAWAGQNAGLVTPESNGNTLLQCGTSAVSVAWIPEGNRLASTHADGRLRWWKADGGLEETSPAVSATVSSLSWRPNGTHLAGCGGNRMFMWAADRTPTSSFDLAGTKRAALHLDWNGAGDQLVAGADELKLRLYTATGEAGAELTGHTKVIQSVSWSKGGAGLIATSSIDGTVRLWKPDGTEGPVINVSNPGALVWSPDGGMLAVACTLGAKDSRVTLWNADGTPGPDVTGSSEVRRLAWSPDGQKLAGVERSGAVKIWTRAGVLEKPLLGVLGDAKNLSLPLTWSTSGRIVSVGEDRTLRCWDEATGQPLWVSAAFSGGDFAAVGADGKPVGSLIAAEKSLVYLVERGGGRIEVLTPRAFEQL